MNERALLVLDLGGEDGLLLCTAAIRYLQPEFKFPAKIKTAFSQMLAIRS